MPAYYRSSLRAFVDTSADEVIAALHTGYAADRYQTQYTAATVAWAITVESLRREAACLLRVAPAADTWQLILEFPIYRLRRRIDAVVLTPEDAIVIEVKSGAEVFESADRRQVEEYAQDLRDFHSGSRTLRLWPVLWACEAAPQPLRVTEPPAKGGVGWLTCVGQKGLADMLISVAGRLGFISHDMGSAFGAAWDTSAYRPVPSVIDAAVALFANHGVREISSAAAKNLGESSAAILSIIANARRTSQHAVVFLTGVPGAGKTLAGLNVVHSAVQSGTESLDDIVYLSGNTPLVVVLREALAEDQHRRAGATGRPITLANARLGTRATVQHINDFLKTYVSQAGVAPSDHVVVFDEAQRAWDAKQGKEKFNRDASEPLLLLELMARHSSWAVCVCLIGSGQEINDGEEGVAGWAQAIEASAAANSRKWTVYGPPSLFETSRSPVALGTLDSNVGVVTTESLHLDVPLRSFRSPHLSKWIEQVISCEFQAAKLLTHDLNFGLYITRDLETAKAWLRSQTRGLRRKGLLASSGARRLRADGLGQMLSATDGAAIAHWYLRPPGDIRSSHALEVPANEYTSQGLEIDFAGLCWGGDLIYDGQAWMTRALGGTRWNVLTNEAKRRFVINSYRVLLSRSREGIVIWVPRGDQEDSTRSPAEFDTVAVCLQQAGVVSLDS